jgi:hypothetical protein
MYIVNKTQFVSSKVADHSQVPNINSKDYFKQFTKKKSS